VTHRVIHLFPLAFQPERDRNYVLPLSWLEPHSKTTERIGISFGKGAVPDEGYHALRRNRKMCETINSGPVLTQRPLFCLQCEKLVILFSGLVLEVSDNAGVFLGYLHKHCSIAWEEKNPGSVIEPLTEQ
jgi:hypothetical protein